MPVFKQRRTKYEPVYYGIINKKILIARSLTLSVNEANFEEDTATQKSEIYMEMFGVIGHACRDDHRCLVNL